MIFVPQQTVLVNNGDSAVLVCEAEGIPPPNVTWYRDGIQVSSPMLHPIVFRTGRQRVKNGQRWGREAMFASNQLRSIGEIFNVPS